ncbi:hypothetical protein MNBD_ALPHA09-1769 [hydrothermal vent metagenome]|uniref:DUF6456 domain-containing protein n=1 Tax=hydrothermal vent metagenome TaxID=652676 RepID=A0A3B0TBY6_9ZZZZ
MSGATPLPPVATNTLTPKMLEREARRLLPVLAKKGARASCKTKGRHGEVSITLRAGQKKPSAVCDSNILAAFIQHEWVQQDDGGEWTISPAGLAWLMRTTGGEDGYRSQHQIISERMQTMPDGTCRPVRINDGENPLGWLRRRNGPGGTPFLNDDMVAAGERLRSDFTAAQLTPGITTDWTRIQTQRPGAGSARANGACDLSDTALAARQRFERALNAVGPEMANVVVDVCCFLIGLGEAESARGWPRRSAKLVLRLALDILARHYGIIRPQPHRPARRKSHVWHRSDARLSSPD